jgi:hypothetical protein
MPKNAAISRLLELERREHLWSRRVLGYPVWGLERLHRYRHELLGMETRFDVSKRGGLEEARARFAGPVGRSGRALLRGAIERLRERDIWVLSSASTRRPNEAGERVCIFAEHLREQLGERMIFLEYDAAGFTSPVQSDVLPIDAPMIAALAAGEVLGRTLPSVTVEESTRNALSPTPVRHLLRDAVYGHAMFRLARHWLARARPRAIFVINAYHFHTPFLLAARKANVPVIELQHGIIHESHPGYVHEEPPPFLPDHLVVFGEHFGELLDRESPCWRGRWSVGGHPWLSRMVRHGAAGQARDSVVLFSQNDPPVLETLRQWIGPLRQALPAEVRLVIKPHPREHEPARHYGSVLGPGVELASNRDDSYALLNRCVVAATLYSTVAVEALAYPCRSAVIRCPYWNEDIKVLVDQGQLTAVSSPGELAALVRTSEGPSERAVAERLFGIGKSPLDFAALLDSVRPRPTSLTCERGNRCRSRSSPTTSSSTAPRRTWATS